MAKPSDFFSNTNDFDFESEKRKLLKSLNDLKAKDVKEFTFYKKWMEMCGLRENNKIRASSGVVKAKIWKPTDIENESLTVEEIQNLKPTVVLVNDQTDLEYDWLNLRLFCHTMEYSQNPGRFIKLLVVDEVSGKYLGVISVASDVIMITDRDNYIGWTQDNKLKDKKLAHSAIGSCIMSTQPFGYNFLGGKLVACLVTSQKVQDIWKSLYNQTLVGMTTTSLYGSFSMYNGLKWWHKCGTSSGKMLITPDPASYDIWHQYLKDFHKDVYDKAMTQKEGVSGPVTAAKTRVISMFMKICGIKLSDYVHGYERGVYYSCFYENTKEFLQSKIGDSDLVKKQLFKDDTKAIFDWWKPKAIERYKKLKLAGELKREVLYYNKMIDMTYEDAKSLYFQEVGR